jgi:hypothetical protein
MSDCKPRFPQYLGLALVVTLIGACSWLPGRDGSSTEAPPAAQGQTPVVLSTPPPRNTGPIAQASQPTYRDSGTTRSAAPTAIPLNPNAPDRYVVQRGDTLWDISGVFLQDPWYWPEIWQINPQVNNPHLIYPGDILTMAYFGGQPVIQLERGRTERLSPRVRAQPLEDAISTIPFEVLRSFLSRPAILGKDQIDNLPYILTSRRNHLIAAAGNDVYVRGDNSQVGDVYNIVHPGDKLVDPDDNEVLGYEGIYVGQGRIRRGGDPSTMFLTETTRETLEGDRLLPEEVLAPVNYFPRSPDQDVDGQIISVIDGVSLIGAYQVVVINRGTRHGLEPGHVLRIWQTGNEINDRFAKGRFLGEKVQLPDEPAGTMLVFRIFDRMSYALVMEATSEIRTFDTVRNPI